MPPVHIPMQQPVVNNEVALNNKILELEQSNRNLQANTWINSLTDEKVFRLELLQSIEKISISIDKLTEKLNDLTLNDSTKQ